MFRKLYFILPFLLLFLFSCEKADKIIEFEYINEIVIEIDDVSKNVVYSMQLVSEDGKDLLILYLKNKKLLVYDLETEKLIRTINIDWKELLSFNYINKDSIFLYYNAVYNADYMHDSILQMIDNESNIKNCYSFKNTPVWCSENPRYSKDSASYSSLLFVEPLPYSMNKIFMAFSKYSYSYIGDSSFFNPKLPIAGHFDTQQNKFSAHNKISLPFITEGVFYPRTMERLIISISKNNNPLYSFKYTPFFYEYNVEKDEIQSYYLKSKLIDTIMPTAEPCKKTSLPSLAQYNQFFYNNNNNQYYRVLNLPETIYGKNKSAIIAADKNYNYIAEGIIPSGHSSRNFLFKNENTILWNLEKTFANKGKLYFSVYKLNITNGNIEYQAIKMVEKDSLEECNLIKNKNKKSSNINEYIQKNSKIKDSSFAVTIVPVNYSCPSCVEQAIDMFYRNKEACEESNIYLILSTNNPVQTEARLKEKNIFISDNVFIDGKEEYLNYHKFDLFNPRLIIVKNNKITLDTMYMPDGMQKDYDLKIVDFYEYMHPE